MTKIGSTKKGVGAAAIQRIRRDPEDLNTILHWCKDNPDDPLAAYVEPMVARTVQEFNYFMDEAEIVQIEGAQGYSLSMYHGAYPYTTSRDVSALQIMADCGVPAWWNVQIIGTARTFPIRVANRFDEKGNMAGWSGPCYADQQELGWSDLGLKPELTTVTKLPRRIFSWSDAQFTEALRQNGCDEVFVNFMNYFTNFGMMYDFLRDVHALARARECRVRYLGFGPREQDVIDLDGVEEGEAGSGEELLFQWWTDSRRRMGAS